MSFAVILLALQMSAAPPRQMRAEHAKPQRGDVAVFDCRIDETVRSFSDQQIYPAQDGVIREVFHIRSWTIGRPSISHVLTKNGQTYSSERLIMGTAIENGVFRVAMDYGEMGSATFNATPGRRGTATFTADRSDRHGESKAEFVGTCSTWIKQMPRPLEL